MAKGSRARRLEHCLPSAGEISGRDCRAVLVPDRLSRPSTVGERSASSQRLESLLPELLTRYRCSDLGCFIYAPFTYYLSRTISGIQQPDDKRASHKNAREYALYRVESDASSRIMKNTSTAASGHGGSKHGTKARVLAPQYMRRSIED